MAFEEQTVAAFAAAVAERSPAPASGGAIAVTGALAAALVELSARFAEDDHAIETAVALRARLFALGEEDTRAYQAFMDSRSDQARSRTIDVPLAMAEAGREVIRLGRDLERRLKPTIAGDAAAAAVLGIAVVTAAARLVAINAGDGDPRADRAEQLASDARRL